MSIADQLLELATPTQTERTSGVIALVPTPESAGRLVVGDGEPVDELHVTLLFLGEDITDWTDAFRDLLVDVVAGVASTYPRAIETRAFAHTTFNADKGADGKRKPCAVYGIGESDLLVPLQRDVAAAVDRLTGGGVIPKQHEPWVPHCTAGFGLTGADLTYLGPVTFDRVGVAICGRWRYLQLAR